MSDLPQTPSFRLDGRRALVTGASSGIGLACAAALAEAGAHVVLASRGVQKLNEVRDTFQDAGFSAESLILDVGDPGAVISALGEQAAFDIVVNSAGMARHGAALEAVLADYDQVMNVNVRGSFVIATEAARQMIAAGKKGSVIFISSQMAKTGGVDRSVYCASKHALEGFQKAMAIEWGRHGIRVNSVCPTFIRTPLTESTFANPERRRWIEEKIKLGRIGEVEDIMGPVLFLVSDASAMITGTSIMVDGGWTAG